MNNFNEQDIEEELMFNLPTGNEKLPLTKQDQESYQGLKDFFNNAYNNYI